MDGAAMHRALESLWRRLFDAAGDAHYERRSDLTVYLFPALPLPQANGPWVEKDSQAAVEALPDAVAEVEATGAQVCVQTRSGHERTRRAAIDLGLEHAEHVPGMVAARHELVEPQSEVEIDLVTEAEFDEVVGLLAGAFGAPAELFASLNRLIAVLDGISWYLGRVDGVIVATAVGAVADDAVGIFNVATPSELRGRGYGAALTARAAQEGFDAGAQFAFLQSSELGHGVYRGLGFRDVEEYVLLTRPG